MSIFDIYNNKLIVNEDSINFFKKNVNKIESKNGHVVSFNQNAIISIVKNYQDVLLKLALNDLGVFDVGYVANGDYIKICTMKKSDFVKLALKLVQKGKFNDDKKALKAVDALRVLTDPKQAKLPPAEYVIDEKKYIFDSNIIMRFLTDGYKNYNFKTDQKNVLGITKNELFFVLKEFIEKNKLKDKYIFDRDTLAFIDKVLLDVYATTDHFNKLINTEDTNLGKVRLNENFVKYILNEMPKNYTQLEQAIYVYIKLCKTLTYDPEFYANSQKGMVARKHEDISRLATINEINNQIVCYEFSQIYAFLLNKLGINYEISGSLDYGSGHNKVAFRAGDFVVSADSVTGILGGDLYNAKINNELVGLVCQNHNKQMLVSFKRHCKKVYLGLMAKESSKKSDKDVFEDFLAMFDALCVKEEISKQDKMKIFEQQSKNVNLPPVERITYLMQLAKKIFYNERQNEQFDLTIINSKKIQGLKITSEPLLIFSFNKRSFKEAMQGTEYYLVQNDGTLKEIYKQELSTKFNNGMFKYINAGVGGVHVIPGLQTEGQIVR